MSPRLRWLLGIGMLVLVLAGAGWFSLAYEQVPEKVPVPSRGEPTYNPFYALRQALRQLADKHVDLPEKKHTIMPM